jgi:hypothetical protein
MTSKKRHQQSGGLLTIRNVWLQGKDTNSSLLTLCMPLEDGVAATERLLRSAFGMYRLEWPGNSGVEFHLSHGDWIRPLRRSGFVVEDLIELRPAVGATSRYSFLTIEGARTMRRGVEGAQNALKKSKDIQRGLTAVKAVWSFGSPLAPVFAKGCGAHRVNRRLIGVPTSILSCASQSVLFQLFCVSDNLILSISN